MGWDGGWEYATVCCAGGWRLDGGGARAGLHRGRGLGVGGGRDAGCWVGAAVWETRGSVGSGEVVPLGLYHQFPSLGHKWALVLAHGA